MRVRVWEFAFLVVAVPFRHVDIPAICFREKNRGIGRYHFCACKRRMCFRLRRPQTGVHARHDFWSDGRISPRNSTRSRRQSHGSIRILKSELCLLDFSWLKSDGQRRIEHIAGPRALYLVCARWKIAQPEYAFAVGNGSEAFIRREVRRCDRHADSGEAILIDRCSQQCTQHLLRLLSRYALLLRRFAPACAGEPAQQEQQARGRKEISCHGYQFAQVA